VQDEIDVYFLHLQIMASIGAFVAWIKTLLIIKIQFTFSNVCQALPMIQTIGALKRLNYWDNPV
jgi:hypothetical protein